MDRDIHKDREDWQKKAEESFWHWHLYEKPSLPFFIGSFDLSESKRQEKLEEIERQQRLGRLKKLVGFIEATELNGELTLPFVDMDISNTIHSRRNVIKHIFSNKKVYPILKVPNYVKDFFEISNLLKICFPNVPNSPKKPTKPQEPVYNSYIESIPDGEYRYIPVISFGKALLFSLIILPIAVLMVIGVLMMWILGVLEVFFGLDIMPIIWALFTLLYVCGIIWAIKSNYFNSEKEEKIYRKYTENEKEKMREDLIRKKETDYKQSMERYEESMKIYEEDREKYKIEKDTFILDFDQWQLDMNINYLNRLDKELLDIIRKNKSSKFLRVKNTKKGYSEDNFFLKLYNEFREEIRIDTVLECYYPDIAIEINKNNIIDIEIDEPYTFDELNKVKEIHYLDNGISIDAVRNNFFLENNWFVLRFSEEQVVNYADTCVKLISLVSKFIKTANVGYMYDYIKLSESIQQKQWTYDDARFMALTNSRKQLKEGMI